MHAYMPDGRHLCSVQGVKLNSSMAEGVWWPCRGACNIVERAFNYAWMQAGLSLDTPGHQPGQLGRVSHPCLEASTVLLIGSASPVCSCHVGLPSQHALINKDTSVSVLDKGRNASIFNKYRLIVSVHLQSFSGDGEQKRGNVVIKQRSDGKPERSTAKKFKSSMQIHGKPRPRVLHLIASFLWYNAFWVTLAHITYTPWK